MNYHLLDENHIEILAGDIAKGIWNFASDAINREGEEVQLKSNTKTMEIRLKRQVGKLDTISEHPVSPFMGMVLGTLWGPIGGLAGTAVGIVAGKSEFLCVGCQLKDGRKFIAYMRNSVFDVWSKACPDAKQIERKREDKGMFGLGVLGF